MLELFFNNNLTYLLSSTYAHAVTYLCFFNVLAINSKCMLILRISSLLQSHSREKFRDFPLICGTRCGKVVEDTIIIFT